MHLIDKVRLPAYFLQRMLDQRRLGSTDKLRKRFVRKFKMPDIRLQERNQ